MKVDIQFHDIQDMNRHVHLFPVEKYKPSASPTYVAVWSGKCFVSRWMMQTKGGNNFSPTLNSSFRFSLYTICQELRDSEVLVRPDEWQLRETG